MKKIFTLLIISAFTAYINAATITITNSGFTFSPNSVVVNSGDEIIFSLEGIHNAVQVDKSVWDVNGTTSNGGFNLPFGGGSITLTTPGTYYYVCTPHASSGMKGVIVVQSSTIVEDLTNVVPDLIIYPNPASEFIRIEFNSPEKATVKLDLIDITGRIVNEFFSGSIQGTYSNAFSLPDITSGKYFVRFKFNNTDIVRPVIIR